MSTNPFICHLLRLLLRLLLLLSSAYGAYTFVARRLTPRHRPTDRVHLIDTLILRDTLRIDRPVAVREEVVRYVTVTRPSAQPATSDSSNHSNIGTDPTAAPAAGHHIADTVPALVLPVTQRVYQDSSYTAYVSGYLPALDSIRIHRPTHYIYKEYRPSPARRWSFGLQGGVGMTPKGVLPYVGVGLSIRLYE